MFKNAIKVFVPENNLANESSHMWHMIKDRPDIRCYWQKQDRPGVIKDKDSADDFQYIINVKMKNDAIRFDYNFFTTTRGHNPESMRGLFREEMERYHYEYEETKNGKGKLTITGKGGSSEQDDLVVVFGMAVKHGLDILRDPRRIL